MVDERDNDDAFESKCVVGIGDEEMTRARWCGRNLGSSCRVRERGINIRADEPQTVTPARDDTAQLNFKKGCRVRFGCRPQ